MGAGSYSSCCTSDWAPLPTWDTQRLPVPGCKDYLASKSIDEQPVFALLCNSILKNSEESIFREDCAKNSWIRQCFGPKNGLKDSRSTAWIDYSQRKGVINDQKGGHLVWRHQLGCLYPTLDCLDLNPSFAQNSSFWLMCTQWDSRWKLKWLGYLDWVRAGNESEYAPFGE